MAENGLKSGKSLSEFTELRRPQADAIRDISMGAIPVPDRKNGCSGPIDQKGGGQVSGAE
jgi:hypothetical protein